MAVGIQTLPFFPVISAELVENVPFPCRLGVSTAPGAGLAVGCKEILWVKGSGSWDGQMDNGQRDTAGQGWTQTRGGSWGSGMTPSLSRGPGGLVPLQSTPAQTPGPGLMSSFVIN